MGTNRRGSSALLRRTITGGSLCQLFFGAYLATNATGSSGSPQLILMSPPRNHGASTATSRRARPRWRRSPRAGGGSDERGKKTGEVFCANGSRSSTQAGLKGWLGFPFNRTSQYPVGSVIELTYRPECESELGSGMCITVWEFNTSCRPTRQH